MLVLWRKIGESLVIGDAVVIVVKIDRGVVKLGIEAPRNVTVLRSEVKRRLDAEKLIDPFVRNEFGVIPPQTATHLKDKCDE